MCIDSSTLEILREKNSLPNITEPQKGKKKKKKKKEFNDLLLVAMKAECSTASIEVSSRCIKIQKKIYDVH